MDYDRLLALGRDLLEAIGEDPNRPGLLETPRRWASLWREFIEYEPGRIDTSFETVQSGQMVLVSGMRVFSFCEHHLIPFWCDVSIAYIPNGKVLGLSKFGRIAHKWAHRLQLQEQLAAQIADDVSSIIGSEDVAVLTQGVHLCMVMRGVKTPACMTTTILRGAFNDSAARAEFLSLAASRRGGPYE